MTLTDQQRLAQLRAQNAAWRAVTKEAENWDTTFLLNLLDELRKEKP